MDILTAIKGRKSIRKYSTKPIEEEKLNKILEAIRFAPSARNGQPYKILVIRDAAKKAALRKELEAPAYFEDAPVLLAACGLDHAVMNNGQIKDTIDASIAMAFAVLQAYELGLGTVWTAGYDGEKMKKALGIPAQYSCVTVIPLGYAAEDPDPKPRKELNEIVCYDEFKE
ncbi:nitroreductase [Anaerobacterium chartisolvens]|uniref:Nitroreductase n=1 Tax=Anaerobacterium chartisolvens TaxID=1297424 RepID=A0A369B650_9FIRM|nr:nitroreductase family protein [Anaerobacterium chartisolvens]RCX16026.1 nitroreductase [Anaerobacterium chartisolvens]